MISLKNVSKKYGKNRVYEGFNLDIEDGEITVILGENGSGKTTIVRAISGLIDYDGEITGVPNKISFVFQEDRLVTNLTAGENIKLVSPKADVTALFNEFGLKGSENRYVKEFSGGKRRKIAIVRALSYEAPLIIFDEPFSSLDIASKELFIDKIKKLNRDKKNTVLYITHDIGEAVKIADRIVVLSNGKCIYDRRGIDKKTDYDTLYELLLKAGKTF